MCNSSSLGEDTAFGADCLLHVCQQCDGFTAKGTRTEVFLMSQVIEEYIDLLHHLFN